MSYRDILNELLEDLIKLKPQLIPFKQMIKLQIFNLDESNVKEILSKLAKTLKKNGIE
jgi:hypothetical protein